MNLIYKGKFSGDLETLPKREHPPGAKPFKEADNMKKLSIMMNLSAVGIFIILGVVFVFRTDISKVHYLELFFASIASMLILFPHELLHAICFKKEVFLFTNLKQGMLFVVGIEDMSRGRFIFMSLLPNLVFGLIPFIVFIINPTYTFLGMFGILAIGMGAGDYYNVFNALTQVPKEAIVYLSGMHSYWYVKK